MCSAALLLTRTLYSLMSIHISCIACLVAYLLLCVCALAFPSGRGELGECITCVILHVYNDNV
jgi:hypothetical protein